MTERDFSFWLQGFFELTNAHDNTIMQDPRISDLIRRHADLVLEKNPRSSFARTCKVLSEDLPSLRLIVNDQFEHVIDPNSDWPENDTVHAGGAMRC